MLEIKVFRGGEQKVSQQTKMFKCFWKQFLSTHWRRLQVSKHKPQKSSSNEWFQGLNVLFGYKNLLLLPLIIGLQTAVLLRRSSKFKVKPGRWLLKSEWAIKSTSAASASQAVTVARQISNSEGSRTVEIAPAAAAKNRCSSSNSRSVVQCRRK